MAAVITTDIFCDGHLLGCDCSEWIQGAVGDRIKLKEARKTARDNGWGRLRKGAKYHDICPRCCVGREES